MPSISPDAATAATEAAKVAPTTRPRFSTLREGSLHASLKTLYAGTDGATEVTVDGFVVDVVRRGELAPDEIVEIQTASLASIRRKLERLVAGHRVLLVHPIAVEKWIVRVDADGAVLAKRRSPKRGLRIDAFDQLVGLATLVAHPNFALEIVMTREEEIRGPVPAGARYRYPREWWRLDRRLVSIAETVRVDCGADLVALLPDPVSPRLTSADLVAATGRSKRIAMRAVYCLEKSGAARRVGRRGRLYEYEIVG